MSHEPTVPMCADLSTYLSPRVIHPRKIPLKILCLGDRSSVFHSLSKDQVLGLEGDINQPILTANFDVIPHMSAAFPRHIPWTMFPVVSEPWFEFNLTQSREFLATTHSSLRGSLLREGRPLEIPEIFGQVDAFVIDANTSEGGLLTGHENLVKMSYAVAKLGEAKPCYLAGIYRPEFKVAQLARDGRFRSTHVNGIKLEELFNLTRVFGIFNYSYRLNFRSIAMKALRAALEGADRPLIHDIYEQETGSISNFRPEKVGKAINLHSFSNRRRWDTLRPITWAWKCFEEGLVPEGIDDPLTLQFLYALRKTGSIDASDFLTAASYEAHLFGSLFGVDPLSNKRDVWMGSGKYKGIEVGPAAKGELALLALGLAELDFEHLTLSITDNGNRFLDCLHPNCEDPDVILRWIDEETGLFKADSAASVIDWLNAFFRKMKTRVNQIPE